VNRSEVFWKSFLPQEAGNVISVLMLFGAVALPFFSFKNLTLFPRDKQYLCVLLITVPETKQQKICTI